MSTADDYSISNGMTPRSDTGVTGRGVSRREFVRVASVVVGGLTLGAAGCGGGGEGGVAPRDALGTVEGVVTDVQGVVQPGFGSLILMYPNGQHTGSVATPDAAGKFRFAGLAAGDYQLRFQAAGLAIIPEPYQHPLKFAVEAGKTTPLTVRIQRGTFAQNQVEIYCGDDFYQHQPDGPENGETVVKVGTIVCWYNVGLKVHTVTGGPWNDSGDLQRTQSYIWVADTPGFYGYECRYSQPGMRATLRVTP